MAIKSIKTMQNNTQQVLKKSLEEFDGCKYFTEFRKTQLKETYQAIIRAMIEDEKGRKKDVRSVRGDKQIQWMGFNLAKDDTITQLESLLDKKI